MKSIRSAADAVEFLARAASKWEEFSGESIFLSGRTKALLSSGSRLEAAGMPDAGGAGPEATASGRRRLDIRARLARASSGCASERMSDTAAKGAPDAGEGEAGMSEQMAPEEVLAGVQAEIAASLEGQIAELKYELSLQRLLLDHYDRTPLAERNPNDHNADRDAIRRTIGRLDDALATLRKGMKETQA